MVRAAEANIRMIQATEEPLELNSVPTTLESTNIDEHGAPKEAFSCSAALSALVSSFELDTSSVNSTVDYITEVLNSMTGTTPTVCAVAISTCHPSLESMVLQFDN